MKTFGCIAAILYISYIGLGIAHAQMPKHACKNKGNVAHSCRHYTGGPGTGHQDKKHDGKGGEVNLWKVAVHTGTFGLAFQDDASVPVDCTCYVSCFFSGDGLPTPDWGGQRQ